MTVKLLFVDYDTVETKTWDGSSSVREVGANKAECLAFRLNAALGLEITAIPAFRSGIRHVTPGVRARREQPAHLRRGQPCGEEEIAKVVAAKNVFRYSLDLGNERHSGQVLLGTSPVAAIRFDRLGLLRSFPTCRSRAPLEPPPVEATRSPAPSDPPRRCPRCPQVAALARLRQFLVRRDGQMATTFT